MTLSLGVLVSGSGSNLQSVLDACSDGRLDAAVRVVVSNKPGVFALERAAKSAVEAITLSHKAFASREAYDGALVEALRARGVDTVVLAGFMRIVTPVLLDAFRGRVINIHPALLPAFPGVDGQRQALEYGAKVAGCTVHFVDAGTDTGPIITQRAVPVLEDDTVETLRARILVEEHKALPAALQWLAEGRLVVEGRRVRVLDAPSR
ncbi:MAG: phosphoribosylglycinamide formyltransferase [Myxococcales bacterium]|nr:phosphoribosylglycinamide formyltransferase [Myxococcales bacterium]